MQEPPNNNAEPNALPPIPAKRYFTIGEVSVLCGVKPHVLRYWEQEFAQLRQVRRRGNRRYYQHHEVLLVRRIRELLYSQGYTINGARNVLSGSDEAPAEAETSPAAETAAPAKETDNIAQTISNSVEALLIKEVRKELKNILEILKVAH